MNKMELSRRKVIVWKKWQLITGSILERDHYNYQSKVYIPYDVTIKNTHSIILNKIKVCMCVLNKWTLVISNNF